MTRVDNIECEISGLYQLPNEQELIDIPSSVKSAMYYSYAASYISAAEVVDSAKPQLWLVVRQLIGQAIELALKAYIISNNHTPSHSHNLVNLVRKCDEISELLEEREVAAIVHLNHLYFRDLESQTKFKSRYPAEGDERVMGIVPAVDVYAGIIEKLKSS